MSDLFDLYARYDGPVPRADPARFVCRAAGEQMMRRYLRISRIRRDKARGYESAIKAFRQYL